MVMTVYLAAALAAGVSTSPDAAAGRVLHFPVDRSLGMLYIWDAGITEPDPTKPMDFGQYLGEATGDVSVGPGKRVRLVLNDQSGNNLSGLSKLASNDLYELHLAKTSGDACIRYLASLTGLKELEFARAFSPKDRVPGFSPHALKGLAKLTSLERLKTPAGMTDTGLAALADALPQLKNLCFDWNKVTDTGLAALPKFRAVEEITIGGGQFTNAGLEHLCRMSSLHTVWLWGSAESLGNLVTDEALQQIRKIPKLRKLKLPSDLTDACLAHLAGHPTVEELDLHFIKVTDSGLVHLPSLPSLKRLQVQSSFIPVDFANPFITRAGIAELKKIRNLEELELPNAGFTDADLAELAEMTRLKHLWVGGFSESPFSDKGMKHLAKLQNLEFLTVSGKYLSDAGISSIASLKRLRRLCLGTDELSVESMARLGQLRSLEDLDLFGKKFPLSGLNHLNGLPHLNRLSVHGLVEDGATLKIDRLPRLEYLSLYCAKGFSLRDDDLACLAGLKQLKWVQLGTKTLTDAGMVHLAGLTELDRLSIGGSGVTDRGLAVLAGMKKLNFVNITGNFTDAGLRRLEGLTGTMYLKIYSAKNFSAAAKGRLRQSLPNLLHLTADSDRVVNPQAESKRPEPGTPAADFTVTTLDGAKVTLSEQRGKVVLLHFWGTWCRPCIAGIPAMKQLEASLKDRYGERMVILHLAMDDRDEAVRQLTESRQWSGLHARIGMQAKLAADYGVEGAPDIFLIGPDGRILLNKESPEGPGETEEVIDKALKNLDA